MGDGGDTGQGAASGEGGDIGQGGDTGGGGSTGEGGDTGQGGDTAEGGNTGEGGAPNTGGGNPGTGGMAMMNTGGMTNTGGASNNMGGMPAGPWSACPATGTCKILVLGDGVAAGMGSPGGYRPALAVEFNQAKKNGKFEFVGTLTNGSGATAKHEGVAGLFTEPNGGRPGLTTLLPTVVTRNSPHIVVLTIGSEDLNASYSLSGIGARVKALVEKIIEAAPNAQVIVTTPPLPNNSGAMARTNAATTSILSAVRPLEDAGKHVGYAVFNRAFCGFNCNGVDGSFFSSGFYPNKKGYDVLGLVLAPQITKHLK
jgi:lysophospholipase L1-like esterase